MALRDLSLFPTDKEFSAINLNQNRRMPTCLFAGAFMGGGSVNQPQRDYHLELVTGHLPLRKKLLKSCAVSACRPRLPTAKGLLGLYKEGNGVAHFLQYVGAAQAYLTFEEVRVVKEMRNNVNRVVN